MDEVDDLREGVAEGAVHHWEHFVAIVDQSVCIYIGDR